MKKILYSIVSHGHGDKIHELLKSLECFTNELNINIIITLNKPEKLPFNINQFSFPIKTIENKIPLGYGANHNQAFSQESADIFCVSNPDIIFKMNPFPKLIAALEKPEIAIAAPKILNSDSSVQYSARKHITFLGLLKRNLNIALDYTPESYLRNFYPDWVSGCFMAFRSYTFKQLQGFDANYFLYCEDADLCLRAKKQGKNTIYIADAAVTHQAEKASHKKLKFLIWHIQSLCKYKNTHRKFKIY